MSVAYDPTHSLSSCADGLRQSDAVLRGFDLRGQPEIIRQLEVDLFVRHLIAVGLVVAMTRNQASRVIPRRPKRSEQTAWQRICASNARRNIRAVLSGSVA